MQLSVWATLTPVLGVSDLARSIRFYTDGLGFVFVRGGGKRADGTPVFAHLRHGAVDLLVHQGDPAAQPIQKRAQYRTMLLYVVVSDVETLSAELRKRGIRCSPVAGVYCDVADPDGNVLRFGTTSQPVLEALDGGGP
jgi:catechol 2,3-dioxygenase-like lactoylglutathione lyase family enzyme